MRTTLATTFHRFARWLQPKAVPSALTGGQWTGTHSVDAYRRTREPTPNELMAELKNTAWTCASINAATCAAYPPSLYVAYSSETEQLPKWLRTKRLDYTAEKYLRSRAHLPARIRKAYRLEAVLEHPLLDLLARVNPVHNSFDLWELTTLYQEVHGCAYWYLNLGPLGVPEEIWVLPAQNVTPKRNPGSPNVVDYYEYRSGQHRQEFAPREIIHFRYPDPRDPYTAGLSPLRAVYESVALSSDYLAFKQAKFENRAIPDAIVAPDDVIGEEERDRLEAQWNSKFRRGGAGKVVVAESGLRVQLLQQSMGDLAALAEMGRTKEDIANAFHLPISYLTSQTNLANLIAAQTQHMLQAIDPRLKRRDEKLNEQLVPLFDPSGRLFLASEDPMPVDMEMAIEQRQLDIKYGVVTINEIRSERGLEPVPWGDKPWLPLLWAPTDLERAEMMPRRGRNTPVENDQGPNTQ